MVIAKNPILTGFYPDPSVCRVGDDYYIVNSSFVYFPGVPLFHSKDLAHWEQVGNILDREEHLELDEHEQEISRGIFAPTIRYHEGVYYMITTNISHGGNFIVTAEKPEGPWSEPYFLGEEAEGIDPSLFFDEDGKCYYTGTRPNPEGVRHNGDWQIYAQELDLKTMKLVGDYHIIWKGAMAKPIWPEGPHIYKINDYYYLVHAEGGTGPEHSIMVARSKEIYGPYEGCKRNPVFTHRHLGKNYPIVYAGHCDLVDDKDGNWYAVMLATRMCEGHGSMGRETFLAKVTWEDEWPVFNVGVGKLEDEVVLPFEEYRFENEFPQNDLFHFWGDKLDDRFLGIEKRDSLPYSLTERKGFLRLQTGAAKITEVGNPVYLGVRQKSYQFEASCGVEFVPQTAQEAAGLVLFQNHLNQLRMEIVNATGEREFQVTAHIHGEDTVIAKLPLKAEGLTEIKLKAEKQKAVIFVCEDGVQKKAADVSLLPYTTEETGGFVGCTIGMYATSNGTESTNYADFAWLTVENH